MNTSPSGASRHYSEGDYWQGRKGALSTYKVDALYEALAAAKMSLPAEFSAVEIGCGNGAFLIPWAERLRKDGHNARLFGIDIAPNAIAEAKERPSASDITYAVSSVADFKEKCDFIIVMDVVEHVDAPNQFLESCKPIAPVLLLHLPIEQSLLHILTRRPSDSYRRFRHIHFYSLETAQILINGAGYKIRHIAFTGASHAILTIEATFMRRLLRVLRFYAYRISPATAAFLGGGSALFVCERI